MKTCCRRVIEFSTIIWFWFVLRSCLSFSVPGGIGIERFRVSCPADLNSIYQFDASLLSKDETSSSSSSSSSSDVWVAVYRSNQNQPSVFVRDEFFHAMKSATTTQDTTTNNNNNNNNVDVDSKPLTPPTTNIDSNLLETPMAMEKPVAVARLSQSSDFDQSWVLDSLRCALRKESMDDGCDGGSEFLEALSIGVDSLLLHHLQQRQQQTESDIGEENDDIATSNGVPRFEGAIRTKATLFSNRLLEDRGFQPVEEISKDMATHVSNLDGCLERYAERSVDTSLNPAARDRALQIVSLLGNLDRSEELEAAANLSSKEGDGNSDDKNDFDPWANIKMQL